MEQTQRRQYRVITREWTRSFSTVRNAEVAIGKFLCGSGWSGRTKSCNLSGPGFNDLCVSTDGFSWYRV